MQALISRNSRLVRKRPPGVDSRVDPYTFTFSQNSAGRVRLSSGCFPRQRRRRGAARAEGDSDVPEKAEALQEARPRREGRDRAGAGQEPAGPRDGARPGEVPVERRRRGQAQPHRHARAGQGSSRCPRAPAPGSAAGRTSATAATGAATTARCRSAASTPRPAPSCWPTASCPPPGAGWTARRRSSSPSPPRSGPTWPAACRRRRYPTPARPSSGPPPPPSTAG